MGKSTLHGTPESSQIIHLERRVLSLSMQLEEARRAAQAATPAHAEPREVLPLVLADLHARIEKGAAEYGQPLSTHNGRDALRDAYEEALDLCLYLRQTIEERG